MTAPARGAASNTARAWTTWARWSRRRTSTGATSPGRRPCSCSRGRPAPTRSTLRPQPVRTSCVPPVRLACWCRRRHVPRAFRCTRRLTWLAPAGAAGVLLSAALDADTLSSCISSCVDKVSPHCGRPSCSSSQDDACLRCARGVMRASLRPSGSGARAGAQHARMIHTFHMDSIDVGASVVGRARTAAN